MLLYLMRHGKAIKGPVDEIRPLHEIGKNEAAKVAQFLKKRGVRVEVFIQSTRKRAQETAEIVKDILNPQAPLETRENLGPDDPTEDILADIPKWNKDTMIVSHLPFLSNLAARLLTGHEDENLVELSTGSVAVLVWTDAKKWKIKQIIAPEDI